MFSPLKGDEERQRLEDKFAGLSEDSDDASVCPANCEEWKLSRRSHLKIKGSIGYSCASKPLGKTTSRAGKRTLKRTSSPERRPAQNDVQVSAGCTEKRQTSPSPRGNNVCVAETRAASDCDSENDMVSVPACSSQILRTDEEKPHFPKTVTAEKTALLLSDDGMMPEIKVPATINQYLREYQREGIRFLYKRFIDGEGAILGDDMGLGKTVQVIALMAAVLGKTGTKVDIMKRRPLFIQQMNGTDCESETQLPFLIVGPASVLYNWVDEIETWGYFTVGKYHLKHKKDTLENLSRRKLDVVVTSFETCRDYIDEINGFEWSAIIVDEAHKIKGMKAETTQALKKLRCMRRFGLTGTPLQNRLDELWCILDWANPGCLGKVKQFIECFAKPIEAGQIQNATKRELALARKAQEKLSFLREKWMLRRTKTLIQDQLPKKKEMIVYCRPTNLQREIYRGVLEDEDLEYVLKMGDPCHCASGRTRGRCCYKETSDGSSVNAVRMAFFHLLLKAANHIALLLPSSTTNENQQTKARKICSKVFQKHPQFVQQTREASFKTLSDPKYCGKMKVLQGMLSVFKKQKCKVLIFSYSTQLLDILETYVMSMGDEYSRLDGRTKPSERVQLVHKFNKDPNLFLFLISTKAGGVGLNLTGANRVVIFDPNWNPTHDLQAQDRAYRIGQWRDVIVYRLVCSGTIEEIIYLRQVYKQQLGNVAISTKNANRYFYDEELFGGRVLFHFSTGDRCKTEDILQRFRKIAAGLTIDKSDDLQGFDIQQYVPTSEGNTPDEAEVERKPSASASSPTAFDQSEFGHKEEEDVAMECLLSPLCDEAYSQDKELSRHFHCGSRNEPPSTHSVTLPSERPGEDNPRDLDDFLADVVQFVPSNKSTGKRTPPEVESTSAKVPRCSTETGLGLGLGGPVLQGKAPGCSTETGLGLGGPVLQGKAPGCSTETGLGLGLGGPVLQGKAPGCSMQTVDRSKPEAELHDGVQVDSCVDTEGISLCSTTPRRGDISDTRKHRLNKNKNNQSNRVQPSSCVGNDDKLNCLLRATVSGRTDDNDHGNDRGLVRRQLPLSGVRSPPATDKGKTGKRHRPKRLKDMRMMSRHPSDLLPIDESLNTSLASISDVFEQCGVIHMHETREVVGCSRIEDHMSRCAVQDVYELHQHSQMPAMHCDPMEQSSESTEMSHSEEDGTSYGGGIRRRRGGARGRARAGRGRTAIKATPLKRKTSAREKRLGPFDVPKSITVGTHRVLIGQTPKAIRRQHFSKLVGHQGASDVVSLAQVIVATPKDSIGGLLQGFYTAEFPALGPVLTLRPGVVDKETAAPSWGRRPGVVDEETAAPSWGPC